MAKKARYEAQEIEINRMGFGKVRTEGKKWVAIDVVGKDHHGITCGSRDEAEKVAAELNEQAEQAERDFPHTP